MGGDDRAANGDTAWHRAARRKVAAAGVLLALLAATGIWGTFAFVAAERERELASWQVRLGIVADSRLAAVEEWLAAQRATLRELADNASLQLYMTELALAGGDRTQVTDEPAQATYLRNLLVATAERAGFTAESGRPELAANVERTAIAGLLLLDAAGRPLAATPGAPPPEGRLRQFLERLAHGERGLEGPYAGAGGRPTMAFAEPVFHVQGGNGPSDLVGLVVGIKPAEAMFDRLRQPGETERTAETLLVRAEGGTVVYLSPLADGTPALKRVLDLTTPDLAAARLVEAPGTFGSYRNYAGREVLATGRAFADLPWTLLRQVERAEALGEADRRLAAILAVLLLAIALAAAVVVAAWRTGTSARQAETARRYRESTERFESLSRFLRLVTDGQPTEIVALDADGRLRFANRQAAVAVGLAAEDLAGKTLAAWKGPQLARVYEEINRRALAAGQRASETLDRADEGERRVVKSEHIPLPPEGGRAGGVLMILEDITGLVTERERRARTLRQLVDTLVTVVDRRDPFSAHHSVRVADVARTVAEAMGLPTVEVATAEFAGALLNLGKILVPEELLTRIERLSEDELARVRDSILASAELLQQVEFDGPVVETIRQFQECWDGSGQPRGLAGEAILPSARVLAVANAFVGMVSARAYRPGLSFETAMEELLKRADRQFDRRAVTALLHSLENQGGRARWRHYRDLPVDAA